MNWGRGNLCFNTEDEIEVTLVGLPRYPCTESTTVCYNNESNDQEATISSKNM